jgi:hypothetical protein
MSGQIIWKNEFTQLTQVLREQTHIAEQVDYIIMGKFYEWHM